MTIRTRILSLESRGPHRKERGFVAELHEIVDRNAPEDAELIALIEQHLDAMLADGEANADS